MATNILPRPGESGTFRGPGKGPIVLSTWDDVRSFLAKHLKPVGTNRKGLPIYNYLEEMALKEKLDVIYPDEQ